MITLIEDWRKVLRKAWSVRLSLLAAALGAIEVALPFFSDAFQARIFGALSAVVALIAAIARLVAQKEMHE